MSELATIHLHGPLGERFGETHRLAVKTPIEAVAALDANYPGFVAAFAQHQHYGLYADGDWRGGDHAASLPFSRELHFCPIIEGRAFVGALLVGALFPALAGTAAATIIGGVLFAGLMLGLAFLLTPKVPKQKDAARDENFAFTGPENVAGQGTAVPLIYGRVHAGSVVVSAGLELGTDLAPTTPNPAVAVPPSSNVPPGTPAPPGGWPAIVSDANGVAYPLGWRKVSSTNVFTDLAAATGSKIYSLWQHPTSKSYYWSHNRGFYRSTAPAQQPNDNDWQDWGHG